MLWMFHELVDASTTPKQQMVHWLQWVSSLWALETWTKTSVIYIVLRNNNESAALASFTATTYTLGCSSEVLKNPFSAFWFSGHVSLQRENIPLWPEA